MNIYDDAWKKHKSQFSQTAVRKHSFDAGWRARDAEVQALRDKIAEQARAATQGDEESS